jgi:hypothetical protein
MQIIYFKVVEVISLSKIWRIVTVSILSGTVVACAAWTISYSNSDAGFPNKKMKSGNLTVDYTINQVLADVDRLSLNTINVPVMVMIDNLHASTMSLNPESIEKAKLLIKELKKRKVNIILEAYPWIANGEAYETDWNPDNVDVFFENWTNAVLKRLMNEVAIPGKVDIISIASNLTHLESYEAQWSKLAVEVKQQFKGLITYKTNWWYTAEGDEASKLAFHNKLGNSLFSKVDFISVAAYFELSDRANNTVEQLEAALHSSTIFNRKQNIVEELNQLHKRWNKPIFFGELGFSKRDYAAKEPWNQSPSEVYNGAEQARGFEAYRHVFTQDWLLGVSIFAIGKDGKDKDYYPSQESAAVIKAWFN